MIDVGLTPSRIHAGEITELDISLTNTGSGTCTKVRFAFRLPVGIVRLRGREMIEASSLPAGQSVTTRLRVRAERVGRYRLISKNFAYLDHLAEPHRENAFAAEIVVDPEREPLPQPEVDAELLATELPYDEWTILRGRITNGGAVSVSDLEVTLSGQVTTDRRTARATLEQLPPGRSADIPFYVCARAAGGAVPVHLDLAYASESRRYEAGRTHSIRVIRDHAAGTPVTPVAGRPPIRMLILGASLPGTESLRIDREIRAIQEAIEPGMARDNVEVRIRLAVRSDDISRALLKEQPRLVHFAGHGGGPEGSFAAEGDYGLAHIIPVDGLVRLFRSAGQSVECVVANACETEGLARGLSEVIPYAIGMRQPVRDRSAIRFSVGFYQAVAAGRPVEDAFDLGVAQMMTVPVGDDPSAPVLFRRGGLAAVRGQRWCRARAG
jgi:CHAT domain